MAADRVFNEGSDMNRIAASHLEETVFVLFNQHLWLESSDGWLPALMK